MGQRAHLDLDRRQLLRRAAAVSGGTALTSLLPGWAKSASPEFHPPCRLSPERISS